MLKLRIAFLESHAIRDCVLGLRGDLRICVIIWVLPRRRLRTEDLSMSTHMVGGNVIEFPPRIACSASTERSGGVSVAGERVRINLFAASAFAAVSALVVLAYIASIIAACVR